MESQVYSRPNAEGRPRAALVTGASAGIGFETAKGLSERGYRVIIVGRNPERTPAAAERIAKATGQANVEWIRADFASLDDVRRLADEVLPRTPDGLDVLVNNAGLFHPKFTQSVDGYEDTWAVNHLAPYLLTRLVLPSLIRAGTAEHPARVVNVSSRLHTSAKGFDYGRPERGRYRAFRAYNQSKLANVVFSHELARRLYGHPVTSNALHPGDVSTNVMRENAIANIGIRLVQPFIKSPEQGAATTLHVASDPSLSTTSGRYFRDCKIASEHPMARDRRMGTELWERSAEQVGLDVAL